nr:unnamed protein product [Callosobruchus chinensis]
MVIGSLGGMRNTLLSALRTKPVCRVTAHILAARMQSLLVMVIGSLGGMRNTLLSALRTKPVCRAAAHILAARMQRARKYFSPSNLRTLYKAQIRPSLEYCSHIWGAAASTTLSILDAVQRRAIRLIGNPALTCHLQPLSHRRAVGDLSLLYQYSN